MRKESIVYCLKSYCGSRNFQLKEQSLKSYWTKLVPSWGMIEGFRIAEIQGASFCVSPFREVS